MKVVSIMVWVFVLATEGGDFASMLVKARNVEVLDATTIAADGVQITAPGKIQSFKAFEKAA